MSPSTPRRFLLRAALIGCALLGGAPAQAGEAEQAALTLINQARAQAGCGPLKMEQRLVNAAATHAQAMAQQNFFSHTGANGSTPMSRIRAAGYKYRAMAENIAAGNQDPSQTVAQWINSAGHRKNMLSCKYKQTGIARAHDPADQPLAGQKYAMHYYWVQVFGTQ